MIKVTMRSGELVGIHPEELEFCMSWYAEELGADYVNDFLDFEEIED
ncbi:MAG: hydrogenase maturation nickel metallochaperone HypA [Streptococcaceae bacterium]|jgi:Zn finger protein HypA/HybF involved in hydrogenase expression|nr:hydrogenase maturation nickel metallochaperone HypA [Streptococcaceae bacterium]